MAKKRVPVIKLTTNGVTFTKIRAWIAKNEGYKPGDQPDLTRMASLLGMRRSRNEVSKMLAGTEITYGTLEKIMRALDVLWGGQPPWPGFSLMDLIVEKPKFPSMPEEFPVFNKDGTGHGHYLDFNRMRLGKLEWGHEVLKVTNVKMLEGGRFAFEGTLRNDHDRVFSITLTRLSDHLCVLHAMEKDDRFCFSATFTHVHDNRIFCGIWTGCDVAWRSACYRCILSPTKLNPSQLEGLCDSVPVSKGFDPRRPY